MIQRFIYNAMGELIFSVICICVAMGIWIRLVIQIIRGND